jgi:hypothetical protein
MEELHKELAEELKVDIVDCLRNIKKKQYMQDIYHVLLYILKVRQRRNAICGEELEELEKIQIDQNIRIMEDIDEEDALVGVDSIEDVPENASLIGSWDLKRNSEDMGDSMFTTLTKKDKKIIKKAIKQALKDEGQRNKITVDTLKSNSIDHKESVIQEELTNIVEEIDGLESKNITVKKIDSSKSSFTLKIILDRQDK